MKNYTTTSASLQYIVMLLFIFAGCKTQKNDVLPQKKHTYGFRPSPGEYANAAKAPTLSTGTLPAQYQLNIPANAFDQGQQGSCVSCATTQTLSIINYSQRGVPFVDGGDSYSPSFLYNQVHAVPGDCNSGSTCVANFNILISQGAPGILAMPYDQNSCSTLPNSTQLGLAGPNRIGKYMAVDPIDAATIKQYIYSGLPVIVAFQVDNNFENSGLVSIWHSFGPETLGSHCALLYGWDDSKNAFKMLNSWGNDWGDNGSTWVDYNFLQNGTSAAYGKIFTEAYVIENGSPEIVAPVANFDLGGNSTTVNAGQPVAFYDRSTDAPTLWDWKFTGATPAASTEQNPVVTYAASGSFTVSLTATNAMGNNTKIVTNYINVNGPTSQPIAQFAINGSRSVNVGASVAFVNQSLNSPTIFVWSFPGGSPATSNLKNPNVMYNMAGSYPVTLTVSNAAGTNTKTLTNYVTVNDSQAWTCGQPFTDPRDGQVYQTVNINGTCWLAENLRYTHNNQVGVVYGNNAANYQTYGCLYAFNDVVNGDLAPPGWHIPSSSEILTLGQFVLFNYGNNGGVLKSTSSLWLPPNAGANNATGFNALPSGNFYNGSYSDAGNMFYMWTATAQANGGNVATLSAGNTGFGGGYFNGNYYLAIRCIKN